MERVFFLCLCFAIASATTSDDFKAFKIQYSKVYKNDIEVELYYLINVFYFYDYFRELLISPSGHVILIVHFM